MTRSCGTSSSNAVVYNSEPATTARTPASAARNSAGVSSVYFTRRGIDDFQAGADQHITVAVLELGDFTGADQDFRHAVLSPIGTP